MNSVYCDHCKKNVNYKIEQRLIDEYKDCSVNVIENVAVCTNCGRELFIEELENSNLKRLYNRYREINEMVTPSEIKSFRDKYDISQRDLVSILGWGKMTINRYERGALASKSHNDILKLLISDEASFYGKVEEAYKFGRINDRKYKEIVKRKSGSDNEYRLALSSRLTHNEDEFNGFRKFDVDRAENLISYLADKLEGFYLTSLNKLLFYIDFSYFKYNIRSITGLRYMRYTHGPVIENHEYRAFLLLNDMILKLMKWSISIKEQSQ